jgi:hypothetical protein
MTRAEAEGCTVARYSAPGVYPDFWPGQAAAKIRQTL